MKRKWLLAILFSLIAVVGLFGCAQKDEDTGADGDAELSVVTTFYPMYEFTQQIAGNRAEVTLMVTAGEDAHHYEPSAQDVAAVNDADVFVYSSEEMEFWVESLFNTIENDDLVIARAADGIDFVDTSHAGHSHGDDEEGLVIHGVAAHYHTGDMIELTAELDEDVAYDHWHWYTRESADDEWETVSGQDSAEFKYEAGEESFEVQVILFDDEHETYAQSNPVAIVIDNHDHDHGHGDHDDHDHDHDHGHGDHDDHDHDHDHGHGDHDDHDHDHDHGHGHGDSEGVIEIVGLADHYHTGDVVTLAAELNEEVDYDHWHWYIRENQGDEWDAVSGQGTEQFEYETTGTSFEVKAVLFDDDHNTYAESEPVKVLIDDHENKDPHIWLDLVLAQEQVNTIRDALIKADPEGRDIYEENAEAFNAELQALHEEYEAAFEGAEKRAFVVQHQAFGYLAHRYHLEQIAIGGLSTEVEPSPSRIAEIGNIVEENNVPVIYYQQGANSSIAQTVASETGTETAVLHDLESLSEELQADDLGYLGAMRKNLEALQLSIQ
ncbi:metal ABC transporter solute-binding protein, Zn/Mn family [Amphibacillus sediminis]|uniref:metal ABC transporter solute-binding protein, Zn/Mn family n=1 Tax=Amphibacillus sediminis TaxID=360185 RepID=UPI000833B892|nr:zinc ABC transporter substrate-binding protein [Amphibacillus sediminis]